MAQIAIAGNQWITQYLLEALVREGFKPSLILNVSDKWSDRISGYVDLEHFARSHSIELYRPKKYNLQSEEDQNALSNYDIDALLVFGWQRLIPEWLIGSCSKGVYGVHGGPLKPPKCRGRAVFNWALLLGYPKFYMYLFRITPEVDSGDIVELKEFDILERDDVQSLYHKNCVVSTSMFIGNLPNILSGTLKLQEQSNGEPSYMPKRVPENGGIFWDWKAERIVNLVRAVAPPYPGAFTYLDKTRVDIFDAQVFDNHISFQEKPGTVVDVFPGGHFIVQADEKAVYVRSYKAENDLRLERGMKFQVHSGEHPEDPMPMFN